MIVRMLSITKMWQRILLIVSGSVICVLGIKFFIQEAHLLNSGLLGFVQAISSFFMSTGTDSSPAANSILVDNEVSKIVYWTGYFLLNIPLILMGFFKIGKKYTLLTVLYLGIQTGLGLLLANIHAIDNFHLFVDPTNKDNIDGSGNLQVGYRLLYVVTGSLIYGFGIALLYVAGASSGGTDFISGIVYLKKKINLSNILFIISFSTLILASVLSQIAARLSHGLSIDYKSFLTQFVLSFVFSMSVITVINYIYPKNKPISITFYTTEEKGKRLIEQMWKAGFSRTFTITKAVGAKTGGEILLLNTTITYFDYRNLTRAVNSIDPKMFFTVTNIHSVKGNFESKAWD